MATYGSAAAAARWVARPGTSAHEAGEAVDVGHADASAWLSRYGAAYELCQTYGNEPWHFELRRHAIVDGCPTPYADPTQDPRMRRRRAQMTPRASIASMTWVNPEMLAPAT